MKHLAMVVTLGGLAFTGVANAEVASAALGGQRDVYVISGRAHGQGERVAVVASIWPNRLHQPAEGGRVDMRNLEPVVTKSGRYRITIPAVDVPPGTVSEVGDIDVHLVISDGSSAEVQEVSVGLNEVSEVDAVDLTQQQGPPQTKPEGPTPRIKFRSADLAPGLTTKMIERAVVEETAVRRIAASPDVVQAGCAIYTGGLHGPYNETFTKVYGTSYVKAKIDHNSTASHTIGVAVKGANGVWGASGTSSISASYGYETSQNVVDSNVINKVMQRYYYTKCNTIDDPTLRTVSTQSKAQYVDSAPYFTYAPHVNYGNCRGTYATVHYKRASTKQGSISGGMDLPFINVSAQSGWDSNTNIDYYFTRNVKLCGSNATWLTAAYISATA
jgi:hypothetical protein